jgi:hypothetical protein
LFQFAARKQQHNKGNPMIAIVHAHAIADSPFSTAMYIAAGMSPAIITVTPNPLVLLANPSN